MSNEIWQVDVGGQIYEAAFSEIAVWIGEGSLLPQDKVRKGNLRWIEAQKVPLLVPFFNAKANGEPMPVVMSSTNAGSEPEHAVNASATVESPIFEPVVSDIATPIEVEPDRPAAFDPSVCAVHPNEVSAYICDGCGHGFCKPCPRSYGGTVKICPMCGAMCTSVGQYQTQQRQESVRAQAITEGFGASDFFNAVAFPFKFKTSLFLGALMFMFFSLGQSAGGLGGIMMAAASIISFMLANMLWFGVLANTVENFSQGKLDENFMPSFDDFSLWDDVVHPFFLYIAAVVTSFGPFIATLLIGVYLVVSTVSSQMNTFQSEMERLPGTQYYAGREPAEQSKHVREVLGDISDEREELIEDHQDAATGNTNVVVDQESREQEELWEMAQKGRAAGLESALGKTKETREREFNDMLTGLLNLAGPIIVIGAITFLWGVFFFPASCAVAGYTRSFVATINPVTGLDTIKRLGGSYFKILVMGLVLVIASAIVGGLFGLIFAPFDLPGLGNLPAKALGSMFGFYIAVVFSCILGYALFKNADKLQLYR